MPWYKQMITIFLVNLSSLLTASAQSSVNHFINPPPANRGSASTPDPTWYLGSVQVISRQTTVADFDILLWQQTIGEELLPSYIYSAPEFAGTNQTGPVTGQFPWLVGVGNFSLEDSNIFWFWFAPKGNDSAPFQSHYILIENGIPPSTSSFSTSSLSTSTSLSSTLSMTISMTTSLPISTGLQRSVSSTQSSPSTSVVSPTPTSSSEPSSSTNRRRERLGLGIGLGIGGTAILAMLIFAMLALQKRRRKGGTRHGPDHLHTEEAQDTGLEEKMSELPAGPPQNLVPELSSSRDLVEVSSRHERTVSDTSMFDSLEVPAELSSIRERPHSNASMLDGTEISELSS